MKKILLIFSILLLLLISVLLINTLNYPSRQSFLPQEKIETPAKAILNLSEAIRIKSISYDNPVQFDSITFNQIIPFLKNHFPLTDSLLKKEIVNHYSLLYKWEGKNKNLQPIILLAHTDVVPAEGNWKEDPFSGAVKNGFVYGRGSLDDKVGVLGIMEATEMLLKENFIPERTIYFAFGHDEEVMGKNGASAIAAVLASRNIEAEFILDEGLMVTEGIVPGMDKPIALIGTAEKGYLSLRLSAQIEGGHGSMPAKENAIGVLSKAIVKIQENPFDAEISDPVNQFLDYIGPEMPFFKKIIFANRWLFKSFIVNAYEKTPSGNALIKITVSPNIFHSGIKENVIPSDAYAILNVRTLPGKSNEETIERLKNTIADARINIEPIISLPPSSTSSTNAQGYKIIDKTIREIFPNTYVAPTLMIAGTDTKHYKSISKNIYRFLPIKLSKEDLSRIHGSDERIKEKDYENVIGFYYRLFKNLSLLKSTASR